MKRIAARISRPHGPTCETGDDTVGVGDPSRVPVSGSRRDQNRRQKCASSVWPAVAQHLLDDLQVSAGC